MFSKLQTASKLTAVEVIRIHVGEHLEVYVNPHGRMGFQWVYRSANGVRWCEQRKAFLADFDDGCDLVEVYRRVFKAVESELGISLNVNGKTEVSEIITKGVSSAQLAALQNEV